MFTDVEWKELARACRALAVRIEKTAEEQNGTTVQPATLREAKRFREYAQRCEAESLAPSPGRDAPEQIHRIDLVRSRKLE